MAVYSTPTYTTSDPMVYPEACYHVDNSIQVGKYTVDFLDRMQNNQGQEIVNVVIYVNEMDDSGREIGRLVKSCYTYQKLPEVRQCLKTCLKDERDVERILAFKDHVYLHFQMELGIRYS